MAMLLDSPASYVEVAKFYLDALLGFWDAEPQQAVTRVLDSLGDQFGAVDYVQGTATCPAYAYLSGGGDTVLVIDGTRSLRQTVGQMEGYLGPLLWARGPVVNQWYVNAALSIIDRLHFHLGARTANLHVGGHSMGGAVALLIPYLGNEFNFASQTSKVTTFGSPRPGGREVAGKINAAGAVVRWMNTNDPVPIMPPRASNNPAIVPLFGVQAAIRAANFVQPKGGVEIQPGPVYVGADIPSLADANFSLSLVQWLYNYSTNREIPHALTTYLAAIQATIDARVPNNVIPAPRPELRENAAPRVLMRQERTTVNNVVNVQRVQVDAPLTIPKTRLVRAYRIGRLWYVAFGDRSIATTPNKKRARKIANLMNNFLETLIATGIVDPRTLLDQLLLFFNDAVTPGTGFSPIMNTVFP